MRERKGEVETCGAARDCPKMERTEQDALGSKGWCAAMCAAQHRSLPARKPELKAAELPQLQLTPGWML